MKRLSRDPTLDYLSERKGKNRMRSGPLDPLGEPQVCWQSPCNATSSDDGPDENDSANAQNEIDYAHSNGMTNIMNQDGGNKS